MDLLTLREVMTVTGLERKSLYRLRKRDAFPASVQIGTSRTVYFRADEVSTWCAQHGIKWPTPQ